MGSAIMGMSNSGLIFLLISINIVTSLQLGISYYPGVNLWVGERLILECRVAGGEHREQETVVWYRQQDLVMGEIISHGDTMVMEDQRFKLEKTVFEDLAIYKIEVTEFCIGMIMKDCISDCRGGGGGCWGVLL